MRTYRWYDLQLKAQHECMRNIHLIIGTVLIDFNLVVFYNLPCGSGLMHTISRALDGLKVWSINNFQISPNSLRKGGIHFFNIFMKSLSPIRKKKILRKGEPSSYTIAVSRITGNCLSKSTASLYSIKHEGQSQVTHVET